MITFPNAPGGKDLDEIEVVFGIVVETVTGGGLPPVEIKTTQTKVGHTNTVASSGPNDWNTAPNWDTGLVPGDGDDIEIFDGDHILYGLKQSGVVWNSLRKRNEDVEIGLPRRNSTGVLEYLPRFLEIGGDPDIKIGIGEGNGPDRVNLNIRTGSPAIEVYDTGSGVDGEPAVQIIGVNAVNTATLLLLEGEVGIAVMPKEEAHFSKVVQRSGELSLGSNVKILSLIKTEGELVANEATIDGQTTL